MKPLYVVILILFVLAVVPYARQSGYQAHLFILSGQSNMQLMDPMESFFPEITKKLGTDKVIFVKDSEAGQSIMRWYKEKEPAKDRQPQKTGDLYDRLIATVNTAMMGREIETITFIWMQGERDTRIHEDSKVYEARLKGLIRQLRTDLKRQDINFVLGRLSDHLLTNPDWIRVRKAQMAVAESDPLGAWVNTDDLNDVKNETGGYDNDLHYTPDGYVTLGKRFARTAIGLTRK